MVTSEKSFPERLRVGDPKHQVTYVLQRDQLLLQFSAKQEVPVIERFLVARKMRLQSGDAAGRAKLTLDGANLRWVFLSEPPESLAVLAAELERTPEVVSAAPVYYAEGRGPETAASPVLKTLITRFRPGADKGGVQDLSKKFGLAHNAQMSRLLAPFHYFELKTAEGEGTTGPTAVDLLDAVAQHPGVEFVELDWLKLETYLMVPNDTLWANQWDMARINLVNAWNVQTGSTAVSVAIIDSGFDLGHPDLAFTANVPGNYTHFNADQFIGGAAPPYDAGPSGVPHGTCCAGVAGALLNNTAGVAGVAGGCLIMPVRLGTSPTAARVAAGINWAAGNGARVGSLSLGTTATAAATAAVTNAWAAGMVLCAATGNSGGNTTSPAVNFPANHANTIAVGASDQADERKRPASADGECWGSQFGAEIDVVAPGVLCWTTDERGADGYNSNNGGAVTWACVNYPSCGDTAGDYFSIFDGTSAATPHVAGLAALLFSQYTSVTNQQVRDIVERTCTKVNPGTYAYANDPTHPNGTWHQEVGYGRIDCDAALRYADLVISDHSADSGEVPSSTLVGGVWQPQIFWGYQPYVTNTSMSGALPSAHQPARPGQDNYVHAYITNRGPATATGIQVTWHLIDYPGTELVWPTDWNTTNQIASATVGSLAPGASVAVEALWPQALVDVGAGYVHPCMVVQAICAQDVGGNLSSRVYEYNNIAQHNISYSAFSSAGEGAAGFHGFTLPFAVGHFTSRAREVTLLIDLQAAQGARVFLDVAPPSDLPFIKRIEEIARARAPRVQSDDGCRVAALEDTRLLLDCANCRAEIFLRAGSWLRPLGHQRIKAPAIDQMVLQGAARVARDGREQLQLHGALARVTLPVTEGQMMPMAVTMEVPEGAAKGRRFRLDVTQLSDGVGTGGVSLDVEAR